MMKQMLNLVLPLSPSPINLPLRSFAFNYMYICFVGTVSGVLIIILSFMY